ncbi:MAG: disulfide bond formation protein B [Planctomycetota bacterium]|jgi:disulfide bond formation protein DsbB
MQNSQGLYTVNSLCALAICGVLLGAFFFQFGLGEEPCPLCLLQRMGMLGMIVGLACNTWFGFRNEHVAIVQISALVGVTFSIRQVLLHIAPVPGEPTGYGTPVFGMHLYTWGVLIFGASILAAAAFLLLIKNERSDLRRTPTPFEKAAFFLTVGICLANVVATFFECGIGPCCEDGPCP